MKKIPGLNNSFETTLNKLQKSSLFSKYINKTRPKFKKVGAYTIISNIVIIFEYSTLRYGVSKLKLRYIYKKLYKKKGKISKFNSNTPE